MGWKQAKVSRRSIGANTVSTIALTKEFFSMKLIRFRAADLIMMQSLYYETRELISMYLPSPHPSITAEADSSPQPLH
jgi:hypothetical protein